MSASDRAHAPQYPESREAGLQAALNCLEVQEQLFHLVAPTHYRIYTLAFYTVDAGLFLSALAIKRLVVDLATLQKICLSLKKSITRLEAIKTRNTMAKTSAKVLTACYWKIQDLANDSDPDSMIQSLLSSSWHSSSTNQDQIGVSGHGNKSHVPMLTDSMPDALLSSDNPSVRTLHDSDDALDMSVNFDDPDSVYWADQLARIAELETTSQLNNSPWSFILG